MAIFIIGVKNLNGQRYFRLLNTSTAPMKTRDMSEEDLMYMLDGNSSFKIENAELSPRKDKIVGKTGTLDKIENKNNYVVLSGLTVDGELQGYRVVDSFGLVRDLKLDEAIPFLRDKSIQNASVVDGRFLRGINWEIPMVEKKPINRINSDNNPCNTPINRNGFTESSKIYNDYEKDIPNKGDDINSGSTCDKSFKQDSVNPIYLRGQNHRRDEKPTPIKVKLVKRDDIPRVFYVHLDIYIDNMYFEQVHNLDTFMKRWTLCDKLNDNQILLKIKKVDYVIHIHEDLANSGYLVELKRLFGGGIIETARIDNVIEYIIKGATAGFMQELRGLKNLTEKYGSKLTVSFYKTKHITSPTQPFYYRVVNLVDKNPYFFLDYLTVRSKVENMFGLVEKGLMNASPYIEHVCSVLGIKFYNNIRRETMRVTVPASVDYTSDDDYGFVLIELD